MAKRSMENMREGNMLVWVAALFRRLSRGKEPMDVRGIG